MKVRFRQRSRRTGVEDLEEVCHHVRGESVGRTGRSGGPSSTTAPASRPLALGRGRRVVVVVCVWRFDDRLLQWFRFLCHNTSKPLGRGVEGGTGTRLGPSLGSRLRRVSPPRSVQTVSSHYAKGDPNWSTRFYRRRWTSTSIHPGIHVWCKCVCVSLVHTCVLAHPPPQTTLGASPVCLCV